MDFNFGKSGKSTRRSSRQPHVYKNYDVDKQIPAPLTSPTPGKSNESESFYPFTITIEYIPRINNKRSYAGPNRLYNYYRKNFFYLFDTTTWTIYTNDHKFDKEAKDVKSTSKRPNKRFRISALLTAYFFKQNFIPNRVRNKYFARIRRLLIDKDDALYKREAKDINNRRSTSTFIRFGYKRKSVYLGLYIPCKIEKCPLPCAKVLSQGRNKCADHIKEYYQDITKNSNNKRKGKEKQGLENVIKPYKVKKVWSNRLGIKYNKFGKGVNNNIKTDNYTLQRKVKSQQRCRLQRFLKKCRNTTESLPIMVRFWPRHSTHKISDVRNEDKSESQSDSVANKLSYDIQRQRSIRMKEMAINREVDKVLYEPRWVQKVDDELTEDDRRQKIQSEKDDEVYGEFISDSTWNTVAKRVAKVVKKRDKQDNFMKIINKSAKMKEIYHSAAGGMNDKIKSAIKGTKYEKEWKGITQEKKPSKTKSETDEEKKRRKEEFQACSPWNTDESTGQKIKEKEKEEEESEDPFLNFTGEVIVDFSDHEELRQRYYDRVKQGSHDI